jgi:hypothetical protein
MELVIIVIFGITALMAKVSDYVANKLEIGDER